MLAFWSFTFCPIPFWSFTFCPIPFWSLTFCPIGLTWSLPSISSSLLSPRALIIWLFTATGLLSATAKLFWFFASFISSSFLFSMSAVSSNFPFSSTFDLFSVVLACSPGKTISLSLNFSWISLSFDKFWFSFAVFRSTSTLVVLSFTTFGTVSLLAVFAESELLIIAWFWVGVLDSIFTTPAVINDDPKVSANATAAVFWFIPPLTAAKSSSLKFLTMSLLWFINSSAVKSSPFSFASGIIFESINFLKSSGLKFFCCISLFTSSKVFVEVVSSRMNA